MLRWKHRECYRRSTPISSGDEVNDSLYCSEHSFPSGQSGSTTMFGLGGVIEPRGPLCGFGPRVYVITRSLTSR